MGKEYSDGKCICVEIKINQKSIPLSPTHILWVLRLLEEGGELQHSQLGAGDASPLPGGGPGRHGQACRAFVTCGREGKREVWMRVDVKTEKRNRRRPPVPRALCKLFVTSRGRLVTFPARDSRLSTQQGGPKSTHLLSGSGRMLAWCNSAGRRA